MQRADFLDDADGHKFHWHLTNWSSALRMLFGLKALLLFRSGFVVLLAPTVLLAAYSLYSNRPTLLVFVLLSCWGFCTCSTGPTGIGMIASMITAMVGFAYSVVMQDIIFAISSVLPGVTWFGSCAILGTTAQYILDDLRSSESSFQILVDRGILKGTRTSEPSHALEPAAGPDSNGESPPPAQ